MSVRHIFGLLTPLCIFVPFYLRFVANSVCSQTALLFHSLGAKRSDVDALGSFHIFAKKGTESTKIYGRKYCRRAHKHNLHGRVEEQRSLEPIRKIAVAIRPSCYVVYSFRRGQGRLTSRNYKFRNFLPFPRRAYRCCSPPAPAAYWSWARLPLLLAQAKEGW